MESNVVSFLILDAIAPIRYDTTPCHAYALHYSSSWSL